MNENDELNHRLAKADPANERRAPELSEELITRAIAKESKLSLRSRFELLGQNARRLALGAAMSGSAAVVALALVVTAQPQPLLQLAAQGSRNNESVASQSSLSSDKMWIPYADFEFVAGPNLTGDTGRGEVYKLARQSTPEAVLARVAAIFDVQGKIKKYPDFGEGNPGYFFGQSDDPWGYDGKNPVISLWWSGTASWNYSNPMSYPESTCERTDDDGNCNEWTEFQPTPELLPTREEAIAKALEVFNGTGLDVSADQIRVDASDWGVSAYASLYVGGQPTNVEWYIGWSSTGEISYAGGHSVVAQSMGSFDTISQVAAVKRLSDWRWSGAPASIFYSRFQPTFASVEPAPYRDNTESDFSGGTSSGSSGSVDEPIATEPMPGEDYIPETLTLTILEVENALLSVWDTNGEVWLVPGYIMINDQGWFGAIISLIEGVIALPKATDFDIMPLPADDSGVSNK